MLRLSTASVGTHNIGIDSPKAIMTGSTMLEPSIGAGMVRIWPQ